MTDINDFYQGDTKSYRFQFGAGVDITGWKMFFTLKTNETDDDVDAVMQVSAVAGDNVLDDIANGLMYVVASSTDTSSVGIIPNTKYHYDFQRVISGTPPDVKTLIAGKVKVMQGITNTVV